MPRMSYWRWVMLLAGPALWPLLFLLWVTDD